MVEMELQKPCYQTELHIFIPNFSTSTPLFNVFFTVETDLLYDNIEGRLDLNPGHSDNIFLLFLESVARLQHLSQLICSPSFNNILAASTPTIKDQSLSNIYRTS